MERLRHGARTPIDLAFSARLVGQGKHPEFRHTSCSSNRRARGQDFGASSVQLRRDELFHGFVQIRERRRLFAFLLQSNALVLRLCGAFIESILC
jgi:hypothetical protein